MTSEEMKAQIAVVCSKLIDLREAAIASHGSGDTWKRDGGVCFWLHEAVISLHNASTCLEPAPKSELFQTPSTQEALLQMLQAFKAAGLKEETLRKVEAQARKNLGI